MSKFIILLRIELVEFFSKYRSGLGYGASKRGRGLLAITLILLVIPFINMSVEVYQRFMGWGQPELGVVYMTMMTFLLMAFTATPLLFSLFYTSDFQFLSPLPIPENYLVLAKLSVVWLYLAGINFVLLFPVGVLTGINGGLEGWSFLSGLLLSVVTPFPPLFLSTLLVLGLSTRRGANRGRKNLLSLFFGFALLGLVLGTQLVFSEENAVCLVTWTTRLTRVYPPAGWSAQLVNGSLLSLLKYLGLNFLCYLGVRANAQKLFRTVLDLYGAKPVHHRVTLDYRLRNKYRQLLRRNLLIISKQPVFFMNTLLSLALPGLILLFGLLSGDFTTETLLVPEEKDRLILFWVGLASAPALLANLSATAISREGKAFWETRVFPVETWVNVRARIVTTMLVNLTVSLMVMIVSLICFPLEPASLWVGLFFVTMLTWFLATTDLVINIYRPYLNWTNPAAAIKNNLNVILSLAYRPFLAVIPLCSVLCLPEAGVNGILFCSGWILLFLTLLVRKYLRTIMVEKFNQICD